MATREADVEADLGLSRNFAELFKKRNQLPYLAFSTLIQSINEAD